MCPSSHSSFSRTSTTIASPLFSFVAASWGETSVMCFFASATSFWKPLCSAICDTCRLTRRRQVVATDLWPTRNLRGRTPHSDMATDSAAGDRRYTSVADSLFRGLGVNRLSHLLIEGVVFAFGRESFVF